MHDTHDAMVKPWIDNFLFGAMCLSSMESLTNKFAHLCDDVNLELKPADLPPSQTLDALGLHFDVSSEDIYDHFVELQEKFRKTMEGDLSLISDRMTPREYFQVFGACMWANYAVARQPMCRWEHALSALREIAMHIHHSGRKESWDEPVPVSAMAMQDLRDMSGTLRNARMTLRSLKEVNTTTDVFTDASSWAWGYLQVQPRLAGQHRPHVIHDIFVAELLAAADAWHTFSQGVPNLHVDNTAAVGALVKGHSSTAKGNLILSRLYQCLPSNARAKITTVPTNCQRADLLSRGVFASGPACGHEHVTKSVGWVVGREEKGEGALFLSS